MAQANRDWLIFRAHEIAIRTAANQPLEQAELDAATGWTRIVDKSAYVQCLNDVAEARRASDLKFPRARDLYLVLGDLNNGAPIPWPVHHVAILRRALCSLEDLYGALQQLRVEQRRVRIRDPLNASAISIRWTFDQIRITGAEIDFMRGAVNVVSNGQEEPDDIEIEEEDEEVKVKVEEDEDEDNEDEEPVRDGRRTRTPGGRNGQAQKNKADKADDGDSQDPDDDRDTGNGGKRLRKEKDKQGPRKKRSPSDEDIANTRFKKRWEDFFDGIDFRVLDEWIELSEKAHEQWESGGPPEHPIGKDDDALEEFNVSMDRPLASVVGEAWQSHIDQHNANADATAPGIDWGPILQLAREGAMQRARDGKRTDIWPPGPSDVIMTGAEIANTFGFGGDPTVFKGQWLYLNSIGDGAQGEAGLWISRGVNDHGNVIDRVVVKDSQFDPEWRQEPRYWVKNSSTDDKTELREPAMHRLVSFDGSSRSVVWFRGHRIYENYFLSRLYMEYCPFKTLETLVAKHAKYDLIDEETLDDNGKPMDRIRIPRRALWSFFEDLAEAACVMAHGHNPLDPTANVRDGWETIIHRDLKPPNIFLGLPRTTGERGIPELKCADFGIAVPYNYAHMKNPQGMLDNGTVGWRAPEHSERIGLNNPAHKLSSATNVWGMGRIMLALIELLHKRNNEVNYCEHEGQVQHAPGKEERLEFYGAKLYELIERCLGPGPRDRITATGLLKSIRENLDDDHGGRPAQLEVGDILEYAADIKWAVERKEG